MLIGLTGGLGSGKSTVSDIFKAKGIPLIDADLIARQVVEPGQAAHQEIKRTFGSSVFDASDHLDRSKLAEHVFSRPRQLKRLNLILHPPILKEIKRQVQGYQRKGYPYVVIDAALLIEENLHQDMDKTIVVWSPKKARLMRLKKNRSYSHRHAEERMQAQLPLRDKCRVADYVLDNSGTRAQLKRATLKLIETLDSQCRPHPSP